MQDFGSGFPLRNKLEGGNTDIDYYAQSDWNLNNVSVVLSFNLFSFNCPLKIAYANGSLLKYVDVPIDGINIPWLYVGCLFSSFCCK